MCVRNVGVPEEMWNLEGEYRRVSVVIIVSDNLVQIRVFDPR